MKNLLLLFVICIVTEGRGQVPEPAGSKRILILLDGSGSMLEEWRGSDKWTISKKLISQTIDSIQHVEPNVEIGLRVFGHQSPRAMKDCEDSKLEVPIAKNTSSQITDALNNVTPKGNTPIAYSLFLSANDFPDVEAVNSIILVTDGIENCGGDPCASSQALRDKRITLKPFIIGVGLNESDKQKFDCVGSFYDASDEITFTNAINIAISQALNITTTQINLINAFGQPEESNTGITLYDAYSGDIRYNFVHTLNNKSEPDTIFINPAGKYNMVVHTTPPVELKNIELAPGRHNIIGIDVPLGTLQLTENGNVGFSDKQCVVRNKQTGDIIYVQNFNSSHKYIAGTYNIEVLTLPRLHFPDFEIKPGTKNIIRIEHAGTLTISAAANSIYGIFTNKENKYEKVYESSLNTGSANISLLPGEYKIIDRTNIKKSSSATKEVTVLIKPNKTYALKL